MLRNRGETGGGTKAPVFALMLANIASELQPRPRLQPRGLFCCGHEDYGSFLRIQAVRGARPPHFASDSPLNRVRRFAVRTAISKVI